MPTGSPVDDGSVGQRLVTLAAAFSLAAFAAASAPGSAGRMPDWAAPQIATVVAHGLMEAQSVQKFRPNAALTRQTLANLAVGLQQQLALPPPPSGSSSSSTDPTSTDSTTDTTTTGGTTTAPIVSNPGAHVTMAELDRRLVLGLGLGKAAKEFAQGARAAGIAVPGRFGTEVVARLLGLRINHPAAQDFLELRPQDRATRAEAAYSAAQILGAQVAPSGSLAPLRLVQAVAAHYCDHPALALWHVSNELGCHNSRCYCDVSAAAFRAWLQDRYDNIDGLNEAWGTQFWSQRYQSWDEITPPRLAPTFPNPTQQLDFARFSSDALLGQLIAERDALRGATPAVPVTTNFMVMSGTKDMDYATWS